MITIRSVTTALLILWALFCAWRKQVPGFVFLIGVASVVALAT